MSFFIEVLTGGIVAGLMYAMVAIGFVLIYKASGVFNFAQGSLVLFAALTFVSLREQGLSFAVAFVITLVAMLCLAVLIERAVLRPLVNRSPMTLFMATLGLSFVIEGLAQTLFGAQVHGLDLGVEDVPVQFARVSISRLDLLAAVVAAVTVGILSIALSRTRVGLAFRAVAADQLAANSVGIDLRAVWGIAWAIAGAVGLIAGLLWGARVGVQFSLSLIVLKALPVLIVGGFSSIPGTVVAGLIVGTSEKLAEIYLGALIGGGIENWFPYVVALGFLLARPTGLFGEARVERV
ncbi:MAG: branched-chain amino acid ABC transporter permease [Polyangiaceae bacterium]